MLSTKIQHLSFIQSIKMKHIKQGVLAIIGAIIPTLLCAQTINWSKYPDYSTKRNPDYSLMRPLRSSARAGAIQRPDHVNNAESVYFPPVFNQDGGSCGSASRIGYMFTYEMDAWRRANASVAKNQYPTHFVWLLTNGNSGKDEFVQHVGVPSAETYGGRTYSKLFGNQEETQNDFGWMTGYNKWYEAMFNRMLKPANFPESTGTEAGREALKNWLWNHNGDQDFPTGGLAGIGVAAGTMTCGTIASTPTNDALGVSGKACVAKWGTGVDHALTIVGYDDRIEFDLNGNGVYGEKAADERGAWIIVNSWGSAWASEGYVYCPYAYGGSNFNENGNFSNNWWYPEIYKVRKNYRPLRTIKLNMDYSHRSELYLMAGISKDLKATQPDLTQAFDHFKYAGDGNNGQTIPAPPIPMLGRWADGKLHTEPMEFGYDLTDLSANFDENEPLKYFFIINTKGTAIGEGHVYNASIIDYVQDSLGLEVPFAIEQGGVKIQNKGKQTILSVIVPGRGIKAPQNVAIVDDKLVWTAPTNTTRTLTGYKVLKGDKLLGTLAASATSFTLPQDAEGSYGVSAIYDTLESNVVSVLTAKLNASNRCLYMTHSGMTLPKIFTSKYDKATIEFWIRPLSLTDWNQCAGPGWGTFMFHANADGTFTAGWNTNARLNIASALKVNQWSHIALVVDGNRMTAYVNGEGKGTITSNEYSGLGGFGDLVFSCKDNKNDQNAYYDEIRIWRSARTAEEVKANYKLRFANGLLPQDLVAYYPGDVITLNNETVLQDYTTNGNHATFSNSRYTTNTNLAQRLNYDSQTHVAITAPDSGIVAGQPTTLHAIGTTNIATLHWTIIGADAEENVVGASPTFTFKQPGMQHIKVVAIDVNGKEAISDTTLQVLPAAAVNASFRCSQTIISCGDRVSFVASQQREGDSYEWTLLGATTSKGVLPCITTSYDKSGTYRVLLKVTDAEGHVATSEQTIEVKTAAPKAAFDVEPATVVKGESVKLTDISAYAPTQSIWTLTNYPTVMRGDGSKIAFTPTIPGVYDVTLQASNEAGANSITRERALTVCNADSKTGLNFMPANSARLTLKKVPFTEGQRKFSIDWWMRATTLTNTCNHIGQDKQTFCLQTQPAGQMRFYMNGEYTQSAASYIIPNEWHHYAVSYNSGRVVFLRDGIIFSTGTVNCKALPTLTSFALGCEDAPMCGMIDEWRIWDGLFLSNTTIKKLRTHIIAPMNSTEIKEAEAEGLKVYYSFNQSGGNAEDATSNANTGVRSGFGPDGDAWSSSAGMFALNFEGQREENVTEAYFTNYEAPFTHSANMVNTSTPNRFMTLKGWKTEHAVKDKNVLTGAHVDTQKSDYLTITTGWDGFAQKLADYKVYQTIDLPRGVYEFTANFGNYEGEANGCYLIAMKGDTLACTADLFTSVNSVLAYKAMDSKSAVSSNSIHFIVSEPTTISIGLLANMQGSQCLSLRSFNLVQYPLLPFEGKTDGIQTVTDKNNKNQNSPQMIFDLSGRRTQMYNNGVYIVGGKKELIIKR